MSKQDQVANHRVSVYVDGFNLYYGMRSKAWSRFYWLDIRALAGNLLKPNQQLSDVRYFTSRITGKRRDKQRRQTQYLDALGTRKGLSIHLGQYLAKQRQCRKCGEQWTVYEEKMSDVNIAVHLLNDAQDDTFDTAILLSGDSDLAAPIESVISRYQHKRVVVVFPPNRVSDKLSRIASATYNLSRKDLKDSQLPEKVIKPNGFILSRPSKWRS